MPKIKSNVFVITFISLFISLTVFNYVYARNNEVVEDWVVMITNDEKEINDTREIKFKVEKTKDVVQGKIAPGMKATAEIEINLVDFKGLVDIEFMIDDSKLNNAFKLNTKFNEEFVSTQKITKVKADEMKKIVLELIWDENNIEDTNIGVSAETIEVPIQINILQHI